MRQTNGRFSTEDCGLLPPKSASDGNINETTSDVILEEISSPQKEARAGALRDCFVYLVEGMDDEAVIREVNTRRNIGWSVIRKMLPEVKIRVAAELQRLARVADDDEQARLNFDALSVLFSSPINVKQRPDGYALLGLTEKQLRIIARTLAHEGEECQK